MAQQRVQTIQVKEVMKTDVDFESRWRETLNRYPSGVPDNLLLPRHFIDQPDLNVMNVPRECGLLTVQELAITENYDATGLVEAIAAHELTAVAVVTAFCKRAIIAHQVTDCLSEWFMDEAIQRAQELDQYQERTGKTVGPLHGLPFSVKEHIQLKGHMATFGLLATLSTPENDCLIIETIRKLGAVFYVKTRQPQGMLSAECASHFGRTLNPHNINLSSGGSSGGEAALIAMKGSPLGLGSDLGGSVRFPASFCGLYGLKGTSGRLPVRGILAAPLDVELNLDIAVGPLSRSLRDLDLFQQAVLSQDPFLEDPTVLPIPWTGLLSPMPSRPLRIGFMFNDGNVQPHPPISRALKWAQSRLREAGFEVSVFAPPEAKYVHDTFRQMIFPDGGTVTRGGLAAAGEPVLPILENIFAFVEKPWFGRSGPQGVLTSTSLADYRFKRNEYKYRMVDEWKA